MLTLEQLKLNVSLNIKYWRKQQNWSQAKLAEHAGISPNFISHIEQGVKNPSLESIFLITRALGLEPYQLLLTSPTDTLKPEDEKHIEEILVDQVLENLRTSLKKPKRE